LNKQEYLHNIDEKAENLDLMLDRQMLDTKLASNIN
jgi:hypothetical protein